MYVLSCSSCSFGPFAWYVIHVEHILGGDLMEGGACEVCWQGELVLQQGALVCDTCGSLVQGFVEETQEYQGGTQTHFHRRSGRGVVKERHFVERETPKLKDALCLYVECLQQLVQRQALELQQRLGINPHVVHVLEHIWLAYISHTDLLEDDFTRRLEHRIKPMDAELAGGEGILRSATFVLGEALQKVLPPSLTLALCFLGCWHCREAVGPIDIVGWALDGVLPYLDLAATSKEMVEQVSDVLPLHFLDPQGVPTPTKVWDDAALVAAWVGLACPPLNVGLWLERWAQELALPHATAVVGLQLYELYRKGCPQYRLQCHALAHALVHAMALVVVAVKFLYGLDGRLRVVPAGVPAPPDWLYWAKVVLGSAGNRLSAFPMSVEEALDLPDALFQLYMDHLRAHIFPDGSAPEELQEYCRLLDRMGKARQSSAERHPAARQQQQAPAGRCSPPPLAAPCLTTLEQEVEEGQACSGGGQAAQACSLAAVELFSKAWRRGCPFAAPEAEAGVHAAAGPGPQAAAAGQGSEAAEASPGSHAAVAGPAAQAAEARPDSHAAAAGPGSEAAEASPGSHAAVAGPATQAAEARPGSHAAAAGPGSEAAEARPGSHVAAAGPGSEAAEETLPAGYYPFFGRAFGAGGLRLSAHLPLDYAAVLTVCAANVGVAPQLLHSVVSELESGMIRAETELGFKVDARSQGRLKLLNGVGATARERKAAYEKALYRHRVEHPDILPGFTTRSTMKK